MSSEESSYSKEILKLLENGARAFAEKDYDLSAELYSEACEISNIATGKDDPDLLLLYGKSLFENAVSKSGVLGAVAQNDQKKAGSDDNDDDDDANDTDKDNDKAMFQFNETLAEEEEEEEEEEDDNDDVSADKLVTQEEEEEESDDDEKDTPQGSEEQEPEEPEQTDFEVAWEILDLTRTIYEEQLTEHEQSIENKEKLESPLMKSDKQDLKEIKNPIIILKKKLSDVYDLLGEVSLETENFKQAAQDFESLCQLRTELYPFHSALISEAYYKLSLSLEFCTEDLKSIGKSIEMMKKAIESMKLRFQQPGQKKDDELLFEMEQRLLDLTRGDEKIKEEKDKILRGILGDIMPQKGSSEEATNSGFSAASSIAAPAVNDLTSMVKKRKSGSTGGKMIKKKTKKQ
ncbi:hypothetical protein CANARDRAFT_26957 [[Candida] arabinofermentans NRRL YB-2248]|uniref:Tetratricopeptide SHNi-TPR domain-containing protein n=1 Tax=[Candida] arabinofermentans NRRL YB-2248 TaxID=983967 RepID=A0A1E4T758_9ASCO|nr:hypothetical protein CANARDRAFT_26957 [[Candida] arabinofermentans NRRL YB-2248]